MKKIIIFIILLIFSKICVCQLNNDTINFSADFDYSPNCINLDEIANEKIVFFPTQIDSSDYHLYNFLWDFGNGITDTVARALAKFNHEGYYCVQLTISNASCSKSTKKKIFVYPSFCHCKEANSSLNDLVIDSDTNWDNIDKKIDRNLIIRGAVLNISNSKIRFFASGRLIIEQGGVLNSNNTTYTNFISVSNNPTYRCEDMWQGIEVQGGTNPGKINFIGTNDSIKHAHIGILLGKRNEDCICNTNTNEYFSFSDNGGIIIAKNIVFYNNGIDIKFVNRADSINYIENIIKKCKFICNGNLLDAGYNTNHPDYYGNRPNQTPNRRNPWAGDANSLQRSAIGIYINQKNIQQIDSCNFLNKEICVLSYNSGYNVYRSNFNKARYGIHIENLPTSINNKHNIKFCKFNEMNALHVPINWAIGAGIFINGGIYDSISENKFGLPTIQQTINNFGIYTHNTYGFRITENEFENCITGVFVSNSNTIGGIIEADVNSKPRLYWWRGNIFRYCRTSILTTNNNRRLKIKCNKCYSSSSASYDFSFRNFGRLANQGSPTFPGTSNLARQKNPAGNEFHPHDNIARKLIWSDYSYTYHRHSMHNLLRIRDCVIPIVANTSTPINITSNGFAKPHDSIACSPLYPPIIIDLPQLPELMSRLNVLNNSIDSLSLILNDINSNLDKGKTF